MKLNDADVAGPFFRVSAVKEEGGGGEGCLSLLDRTSFAVNLWLDRFVFGQRSRLHQFKSKE